MIRPSIALAVFAVTSCSLAAAQAPKNASPGRGTIVVGSYSGHLTAVDEATGAFTKIPLKTGPPFAVRLSPDRSRFYVQSANQEHFEVVDVRTRQTLDTFTLGDARRHVLAYEADPRHKTMVIVARTATKELDRWEIGPVEFLIYDFDQRRVTRTVPWTIDPEPVHYSIAIRFSPDGRLLYVFGDTVVIYDVATMTEVDTWNLSLPDDPSLGRFEPGPWDDAEDPQGALTGLFVMRDAVMKRKLLVVGRVDLAKKSVDVFTVGPAPVANSLGFHVAPDRRTAHLLLGDIGRHELWTIDLEAHRVRSRVEVPTRTRMQIRGSSNGNALYFYEAGRTIEIYTADASTRLRTIELDSDMMYATFVIVPPAAPGGSR
jgi:hypothetical protein